MTRAECEETVLTALALAMSRDGSSGGLARITTITKDGAQRRMVRCGGPDRIAVLNLLEDGVGCLETVSTLPF